MKKFKIMALIGILGVSLIGCNRGDMTNKDITDGNINESETIVTITPDKAKEIALNHAGLTADDVTFVTVDKDIDDAKEQYEVEFYANGKEYDYEINTKDGQIISFDEDIDDFTIPHATPTNPQTTNPTAIPTGISADKAKEIALNHAGVKNDQVKFVKVERDYDNGKEKYEVEFIYNNVEYDYEIDANTGDILANERG